MNFKLIGANVINWNSITILNLKEKREKCRYSAFVFNGWSNEADTYVYYCILEIKYQGPHTQSANQRLLVRSRVAEQAKV